MSPRERESDGPGVAHVRGDRIRACLLGGALGDALGAPVEFLDFRQIQAKFGLAGIRDFAEAYGREGAITDDTQMTLFTADGVLRAQDGGRPRRTVPEAVHEALLSWLVTQGRQVPERLLRPGRRSPLLAVEALHARRAPGATCLSALRKTERLGAFALNDSKGCGAVMRIAPLGLISSPDAAFELASDCARQTHGHRESTLSSGTLAALLSHLVEGATLETATQRSLALLEGQPTAATVLRLLERAVALGQADAGRALSASARRVRLARLGEGWVAEEALAIGLYCAWSAPSFEEGVIAAVNHDGDSDSTGSIAGQILGAMGGMDALPPSWCQRVELRPLIVDIGTRLAALGHLERLEPARSPSLPQSARTSLNRCNLPPSVLGGLTFQRHPVPLAIDGVRTLHAELFEHLRWASTAEERQARFEDYMTVQFRLEHPEEAGWDGSSHHRQRQRANYRRLVRGWSVSPEGTEAAVFKYWVESRFGLLTRYHKERLEEGESASRARFVTEAMAGLYATNGIEAQLDLLYTFCQFELRRRHPERDHLVLFRGMNSQKDDLLARGPCGRVQLLLSSLNSFSASVERASEFGDDVVEASIPLAKIVAFDGLLPHMLGGEEEYLVLGGAIEATRIRP